MNEQPSPASPRPGAVSCDHLRHKGMYVLSDEPDAPARGPSSTAYWCLRTMKALGPDGQPATADACVEGRGCCAHHGS